MFAMPPRLPYPRRYSCHAGGRSVHSERLNPQPRNPRMPNIVAESLPRLKRFLPRLKNRRIGVLGDLMLDRYLWGTASRLSPEAAVPVVDFVEQSECLGGAGNVAANLAALGARVEAFGVIGSGKNGPDEPGIA